MSAVMPGERPVSVPAALLARCGAHSVACRIGPTAAAATAGENGVFSNSRVTDLDHSLPALLFSDNLTSPQTSFWTPCWHLATTTYCKCANKDVPGQAWTVDAEGGFRRPPAGPMDERSMTVDAGALASYAQHAHKSAAVVDKLSRAGKHGHSRKSNGEFLTRLSAAERADEESAAASSAVDLVPIAPQRPPIQRRHHKQRLSRDQIEHASDHFWKHDVDADATIDRDEWKKLVDARTSSIDLDAAFARADVDGDGTINLREWLDAKEAVRLADGTFVVDGERPPPPWQSPSSSAAAPPKAAADIILLPPPSQSAAAGTLSAVPPWAAGHEEDEGETAAAATADRLTPVPYGGLIAGQSKHRHHKHKHSKHRHQHHHSATGDGGGGAGGSSRAHSRDAARTVSGGGEGGSGHRHHSRKSRGRHRSSDAG